MYLPNRHSAIVPEEKVLGYLLNNMSERGGDKADYFISRGYSVERWQEFAAALIGLAHEYPVVDIQQRTHGVVYVIEGYLSAPDDSVPFIRTIWMVGIEESVPRLVTAYPVSRRRRHGDVR